jgi:hypothetical protein
VRIVNGLNYMCALKGALVVVHSVAAFFKVGEQ